MLTIDGAQGEGGGQILRTALALSLATGKEFRIEKIRAGRDKPGLQNQHLAAVQAAAAVGQADVEGATKGSQSLLFRPHGVTPGDHAFVISTAGSTTLVLQTVLPALMIAASPSALVIEGGTHNPLAPPFEFIAKTFLPIINRMGPTVRAKLDRHGFYPAGGGKIRVTIEPTNTLARRDLTERGRHIRCCATALLANLPGHIGERELKVLKRKLPFERRDLAVAEVKSPGPGNVLLVEIESANITEVVAGFGERGLRAEIVAERTAKEAQRYLDANVFAGEHLADQLLLPLALAGGGSFTTLPLSGHSLTNIEVIRQFVDCAIAVRHIAESTCLVTVN